MICLPNGQVDKSYTRVEELHFIAPMYYAEVKVHHHPECSNVVEDLHDQGLSCSAAMSRCRHDCILGAPISQFMLPAKTTRKVS